jgi:cytochrome c oxidase subunit 2
MALHVVAQAPQEFDAWLARQSRPAEPPATPLLTRGRHAFGEARCAACHSLREDAAAPPAPPLRRADEAPGGPDLTHVGARLHLGAGVLRNGPEAMRAWIADVQAHKPGARMPSFVHLGPGELEPLAAYLSQLQ